MLIILLVVRGRARVVPVPVQHLSRPWNESRSGPRATSAPSRQPDRTIDRLDLRGAESLRPSFKREKRRKGESLLKSVRQLIESVNDTLKGQLDLEQHGGRTFEAVAVRVAQRVLALAAAIRHNHKTAQPAMRSLITSE